MFPIALDLTKVSVVLAGKGELLQRRLAYLDEDGAGQVRVFSPEPTDELRKAAGTRLSEHLPASEDIQLAQVVLVAGLERDIAASIAEQARAMNRLVNVEDINDLCDFYFTANVRRGELVIAVSTSGASPTLARKIRDAIAQRFGLEWAGYVRELAMLRQTLKGRGASMREVIDATEAHLKSKGWLEDEDKAA